MRRPRISLRDKLGAFCQDWAHAGPHHRASKICNVSMLRVFRRDTSLQAKCFCPYAAPDDPCYAQLETESFPRSRIADARRTEDRERDSIQLPDFQVPAIRRYARRPDGRTLSR